MKNRSSIVFLGDAQVDIVRGEIIQAGKKSIIEPKIMAVFVYLMSKQGLVVSSTQIHEQVWQDTIVSPSTLQRAIAILRKALGDNSKDPKYIKTYPRRGYSLVTPVIEKSLEKKFAYKKYFNFFLVCLIVFVSIFLYFKPKPFEAKFDNRNIITSSQFPQYQSQFSPKENNITYIKKGSNNKSVLVQYDLVNKTQEIISKEYDEVISFDYSIDGESLFILAHNKGTTKLIKLNLNDGSKAILGTSKIGLGRKLKQVKIGANNQLYILRISDNFEHSVYSYQLDSEEFKFLWSAKSMYGFGQISLSHNYQFLAIHFVDKKQKANIQFVDLSTFEFKPLLNHKAVYAHIAWHPDNTHILISDLLSSKVKFMNMVGELSPATIASHKKKLFPDFNSEAKLLITETSLDNDLYVYDSKTSSSTLISDSIHQDLMAVPNFNNSETLIISRRLGKTQIFLKTDSKQTLLYANDEDVQYISPPIWSEDSENIAFSADGNLVLIQLETSVIKQFTFEYDINRVLDWQLKDNKILLKGLNGEQNYLLEWSVSKNEISEINNNKVINAFYQNTSHCLLSDKELKCSETLKWQPESEKIYDGFKIQNGFVVVTKSKSGQQYYKINNDFTYAIKYNFPKGMFHLTGTDKHFEKLYFSSDTKKLQNIIMFD